MVVSMGIMSVQSVGLLYSSYLLSVIEITSLPAWSGDIIG